MLNTVVIITFSVLDQKYPPFSGKFDRKNPNSLFKLKFDIQTKSNKRKSVEMFTLSFLDLKYTCKAN